MNQTMLRASETAPGFLNAGTKLLLIGGRWVQARSGGTFDVIDPSTEKVLASVALAGAADVDAAVQAAQRAFEAPSWADITPHARGAYLLRIADLMETHAEELAVIQSFEMGQVLKEARAFPHLLAETFRYYAGWPSKMFGRTNPSATGVFNYTVREPLGVVGSIIPWNGPLLAATWKIAPALAAGNTVVLKPAELAPLAVLRLGELMEEAGLPPGVVNMVPGYGAEAGEALINHPMVAKIAFTGSTAVGRHILATAAGTLKKVGLELGGKSPTVIFADADLDKAAGLSVYGFAGNSGQMCVAGSRILVQESVYDEVAEKLVAAAGAMKAGSPFDEASAIGPVISRQQFDKVHAYIDAGEAAGARRLTGGERHTGAGYFIQPTIFADAGRDLSIVREEIFGPVAVLTPFTDEADAVAQANDTEFGLTATVWTRDVGRGNRMSRALKAGTVWVNTMFNLDPVSPFGGYKASGLGRELGPESIDDYTQMKSVYVGS